MFHKALYSLVVLILMISCERNTRQEKKPEPVTEVKIKLEIQCENEKLLIEKTENNLEYSFDTISSTKSYWNHLRVKQEKSMRHLLYPYTSITTDTPSLYNKLNISLVGLGEFKHDERLKMYCFSFIDSFDSSRVQSFYNKVSRNRDTSTLRNKAEIRLHFYRDSIFNIGASLKTITAIYLAFQREHSKSLFKKELCYLTTGQLDSLKRNVPFRIRLMRSSISKGI